MIALLALAVSGCPVPKEKQPTGDDAASDQTSAPAEAGETGESPCEAGGCADGQVCTMAGECAECMPGTEGCPCASGCACAGGTCSTGVDPDGPGWSVCHAGAAVECSAEKPCPGDAHCTDSGVCAWLGPLLKGGSCSAGAPSAK